MFSGFRFSLRHLLVATAIVGGTLAALEAHSAVVYRVFDLLFLGLLAIALAGAICAKLPARAFWAGAASMGLIYVWLLISVDTRPYVQRSGVIETLDSFLVWHDQMRRREPVVGDQGMAQWNNSSYYASTILEIDPERGYLMRWHDGSSPTWVLPRQFQFGAPAPTPHRGHSILAVLIALTGGAIGRFFFGGPAPPAAERETQARSDSSPPLGPPQV